MECAVAGCRSPAEATARPRFVASGRGGGHSLPQCRLSHRDAQDAECDGRIVPPFCALDQTVFHLYAFDVRTITRLLGDVGFAECRVAPAELNWTTAHDAASNRIKRLVVGVVEGMDRGVYALTAGRYLHYSSMLTIGIKIE